MLRHLLVAALLAQATARPPAGPARSTAAPARPPATRPVASTFEEVLAGRLRPGMLVTFPALVLASTAIQVRSAGRTSYYALAVADDSAYVASLRKTVDLEGPGREIARRLESAIDKDDAFRAAMNEYDRLTSDAKPKLDPSETVAVELAGFESRADAYNWETIVDKNPYRFVAPPPISSRFPNYAGSADSALEKVKKLAGKRPPDLEEKLPDLSFVRTLFVTKEDAAKHNAMVDAFNAELVRRRRYSAQVLGEGILVDTARAQRLITGGPQSLVATAIAPNTLAVETLTKIHGKSPRVFLKERGAGETLARRLFPSTTVLIATYPAGASLKVNGEQKGTTPFLLRDAAIGSPLALAFDLTGYAPREVQETVKATPEGVKRIEYVLEPAAKP
jgi:hypothetical protein